MRKYFRAWILHNHSKTELNRYLAYRTPEAKEMFYKKYEEAAKLWDCQLCHQFELKSMEKDYVGCDRENCNRWYHMTCVGVDDEDADFVCPECRSQD